MVAGFHLRFLFGGGGGGVGGTNATIAELKGGGLQVFFILEE